MMIVRTGQGAWPLGFRVFFRLSRFFSPVRFGGRVDVPLFFFIEFELLL